MIPRKIHYCWLSGEELPPGLQQCLASWREVMPDYEIVRWDAGRFDIQAVPFVAEACRARKWAFASDYLRLHALYTEGGIYLDCDVRVRRRFDEFLGYRLFTAVEYHPKIVRQQNTLQLLRADGSSRQAFTPKPGIGLQAAVIGGEAGHAFFGDCLDYYAGKHFVLPDGRYLDQVIAPDIYAMVAEKYGFRYRDELQRLRQDMLILPSAIIAGNAEQASAKSYAVHYCAGSWRDAPGRGLLERTRSLYRSLRARAVSREESTWKSH